MSSWEFYFQLWVVLAKIPLVLLFIDAWLGPLLQPEFDFVIPGPEVSFAHARAAVHVTVNRYGLVCRPRRFDCLARPPAFVVSGMHPISNFIALYNFSGESVTIRMFFEDNIVHVLYSFGRQWNFIYMELAVGICTAWRSGLAPAGKYDRAGISNKCSERGVGILNGGVGKKG